MSSIPRICWGWFGVELTLTLRVAALVKLREPAMRVGHLEIEEQLGMDQGVREAVERSPHLKKAFLSTFEAYLREAVRGTAHNVDNLTHGEMAFTRKPITLVLLITARGLMVQKLKITEILLTSVSEVWDISTCPPPDLVFSRDATDLLLNNWTERGLLKLMVATQRFAQHTHLYDVTDYGKGVFRVRALHIGLWADVERLSKDRILVKNVGFIADMASRRRTIQ